MRPSKRRGWLRRSFRSVRPTRGFTVPDTLDRLDNLPRLSQTRTMCSLIHNDAASMTGYPRVDLLPRGPATQMHRATFSARSPACSAAARATDRPGLAPNNRDRDQTQITFSATFSKRYRYAFFFSSSPLNVRRGPLTHPLFFSFPHPQLLRPEVERHLPLWSWLGAACGAGLGFITANVPGLVVGAYTGNRLGAIRDAKGKSVAAVFSELGGAQKAEVRRKRLRAARPNSALITRPAYRSCARSP